MKRPTLIFAILLAVSMSNINMFAQSTNSPAKGTISDLTYKGTQAGDIVYEAGDYDQPPAGEVMVADWKNLQVCNQKVGELLAAAPNDDTGKQSSWYGQLQTWKTSFDQFIASKTQVALFALVPTMAAYAGREDGTRTLSSEMENIEGQMRGMGYYVMRAMANHVTEQQAVVTAGNLSNFVEIFAVPGFVDEGSWEDEKMPIDAPGVMVLDAAAVVTLLKAGPWQQAKQFLGGATTASGFFARYTGSGDGLALLKTKYAAYQSAIDAKFSELKTWVDQQEQQAGSGN